MTFTGPALGLIELESIGKGLVVADALVKRAQVKIVFAEAVSPGKYLLIFSGEVAEVEESFAAGLAVGGARVLDKLYLPQLAKGVREALADRLGTQDADDSVGIVETHTVAATLLAADTALKYAQVKLTHLHLARGIGGKGYFMLAGAQHDVEAGLSAAASSIASNLLVTTEIVERPHVELRGTVIPR